MILRYLVAAWNVAQGTMLELQSRGRLLLDVQHGPEATSYDSSTNDNDSSNNNDINLGYRNNENHKNHSINDSTNVSNIVSKSDNPNEYNNADDKSTVVCMLAETQYVVLLCLPEGWHAVATKRVVMLFCHHSEGTA